jgi:ABC-type polysaccharide/polyol phosphate export permease
MPTLSSYGELAMTTLKPAIHGMGFLDGVRAWRIWTLLSYQDIVLRYRGSALGPVWMVANLGVIMLGVTILYSELLNQTPSTFMPFLATSLVLMNVIWPILLEGCHTFAASPDIVRQVRMPLSVLVMRTISRNMIVLAHNAILIVIVFVAFNKFMSVKLLETMLGLVLLLLNLGWISVLLAVVGARFRDAIQIVTSILNFMGIFTPIYWLPSLIKENRILLDINPLYHMIEIVRQPLLGDVASALNYTVTGVGAIVGWLIALFVFNWARRKVAFWV